jgi:hypothetical protein
VIQGTEPFWPNTLNEWLGAISILVLTMGGSVVASWRWLMKPIRDSVRVECEKRKEADNGIGGRVKEVEDRSTRVEERLNMLERAKELSEERGVRTERDMGSLTKSVGDLAVIVNSLERERLTAQGELMAKMAELNGKLDLLAQLTQVKAPQAGGVR